MHRHEGSPLYPLVTARGKRVDDLRPRVLTKRPRWSLLAVVLIASGSASLGVVGLTTPASASTPTSVTFNYTGSTQIFTVPTDVVGPISFVITAGGGGGGAQDGGSATGGTGGDPAVVSGDLTSALPGDSFTVVVGGGGGGGLEAYATSGVMVEGGWGDNGSGGSVSAPGDAGYGEVIFGGAGGGMSAIESNVSCPSGSSDYCAVAGGGGGGGAMSYSDDTGGAGGYGGSGGPDGAVGGVGSYTDYCVSEFRATATPGGAGGVQGVVSPGGAVSETVSDPPPNGTGGGGGGGAAGGAYGDGAEASGGTCYMGAGGGGGAASYVDTTDTTSSQVSEASSGGGAGGSSSSPSVGIAGAAGSVTLTYTLGIPPQITSTQSSTTVLENTAMSEVSFAASGYPAPTWSTDSSLPAGVTLSAAGVLSGTPTTSGAYPITITAANGVTPDATQAFTLTISAPPSGGGGGGGSASPAPAPLTTPTTTTTTLPPSPTPTSTPTPNSTTGGGSTVQTSPPPVLTSYAVRAVLSGTLRQTVTCSAAPTAIHESTAKGKLQALGLSLSCKAGKVKATLLVSIASKIEVKKKTTKTHKIVKTKTAIGDIVQGHVRKAFTLRLTVTPKYST